MRLIFFILFLFLSLEFSAQQSIELCDGESKTVTYFSTTTSDGLNYWYVNNTSYITNELTYTFSNVGTYNIVVRRENGPCYVEDSLQVIVTECPGIIYWVPNTFTPDGNEYNNEWGPVFTSGYNPYSFELIVLNRWGQTIWVSYDVESKWDGTYNNKMCQDGTYFWIISFGVEGTDEIKQIHGHLTIVR
jgi:gliding motility-associated-like protein